MRVITAPDAELKREQRRILRELTPLYDAPAWVTGFVQGRSIVDNAQRHRGHRFVYNIDLEDFFPSISRARVEKALVKVLHLPKEHAKEISQRCCCYIKRHYVLPQGAPTSPLLSNIVCHGLDRRLSGLAERFGLTYSRYADDITFSGNSFVFASHGSFCQMMRQIVADEGFRINERKVRLQKRGGRQEVTGLVVGEKVNVSRQYIKYLRCVLRNWELHGPQYAQQQFLPAYKQTPAGMSHKGKVSMLAVLEGKLDYLKMVKGEKDGTYKRLRQRFDYLKMLGNKWYPLVPTPGESGQHTKPTKNQSKKKINITMKNKVYTLDTPLEFGKYKGFTLRDLVLGNDQVTRDMTYVAWLVENVFSFSMDDAAAAFCMEHQAIDEMHLQANAIRRKSFLSRSLSVAEMLASFGTPRAMQGQENAISTGWKSLDCVLGGLFRGGLCVIGGRPAMGKTAFALSMAVNMAKTCGREVLWFSLNEPNEIVTQRLMWMNEKIGKPIAERMRMGAPLAEWEKEQYQEGVKEMSGLPISFDDTGFWTANTLCSRIAELKNARDIDVVIVDHLQAISNEMGHEMDINALNYTLHLLKQTARDLDISIVLLSDLNRSVETRGGCKYPTLSDLRSSGDIEGVAAQVMLLYRPEYYEIMRNEYGDTRGMAEVIVAKNKCGCVDTVIMGFDHASVQFYEKDASDFVVSDDIF